MTFKMTLSKILFLHFALFFSTELCAQSLASKIPQNLIQIDDQNKYALVLEKQNHILSIYRQTENNLFEVVKTYLAMTGKKEGDKQAIGDARTPEGVYFITKKLAKEHLASKYGPGAFVLDYPNVFDTRSKKSGYGIWIHGIDENKKIESLTDTKGCVALQNEDLIDIQKYISIHGTPIIISQSLAYFSSKQDLESKKEDLLHFLELWRQSWEKSDLDQYISFYSNTFKSKHHNKNSWFWLKKSIASSHKDSIHIELSNISIYRFKDEIVISFDQKYTSPGKNDFGRKFLYLREADQNYKIEEEKFYPKDV